MKVIERILFHEEEGTKTMTDSNLLREDGTYRYGTEEYEAELVEWEYSKRFTEHEDAEYEGDEDACAHEAAEDDAYAEEDEEDNADDD